MTSDFYCDEVLSGKTGVERVKETANVLAFRHTRPAYPVHIVVIPKRHSPSMLDTTAEDAPLLVELLAVVRECAAQVVAEQGGVPRGHQHGKLPGFEASSLACDFR